MKKTILWQKWTNPFEPPTDDAVSLNNIDVEDFLDRDEWGQYNNDENLEEQNDRQEITRTNTKAVITPMGIVPFNEHTACTKTFKFWIGHTNFDISPKAKNIIENTQGVETLDIFTRYRFRISIGKAFQDRSVMQKVQNNLYEKL